MVLLTLHRVGRGYTVDSTCNKYDCPIAGVIVATDMATGTTRTHVVAKGQTLREVLQAGPYLFQSRRPSCVMPLQVRVRAGQFNRIRLYCIVY